MIVFYIQYPYVSAGLRRTYNKKLEVFEIEVEKITRNSPQGEQVYYQHIETHWVHAYNNKKAQWIKKPSKKHFYMNILEECLTSTADITGTTQDHLYTTLEAAIAAKLMLIQRMAITYKKELVTIQELLDRNVPDVQKPLDILLDEHPDLFI